MQTRLFVLAACLGALIQPLAQAADLPGPQVSVTSSNTQQKVTWTPYPAADLYRVFSAGSVTNVFTNDTTGAFSGPTWTTTNASPSRFYKVAVTPMSSNALLNANVLNRLAYGPTPDELERVAAIGPQAYINEQLAPDGIPEPLGTYTSQITNSAPTPPPADVWYKVVQTGTFSSTNFYIYMNVIGEAYLDDIVLVAGTNAEAGANVLVNGDFESALTPTWTVSPNHVNSRITNNPAHSGSGSLHVVANPAGSTQGSSIWQSVAPGLLTTETLV